MVLVDSNAAMQIAYRHGAVAAVPAELETVQACLVNLLETATVRGAPRVAGRGEPGLRRLQRVFGDLKSGLASATVALNLMQLVSESYERAVIFLVKRDRLAPLGAFGFAHNGSPLANAVRRLEITPYRAPAGGARLVAGADRELPERQSPERTGCDSRSPGQRPGGRLSGRRERAGHRRGLRGQRRQLPPLRDVELLEVAAEQVGIAFENELLRRQLGR